LRDPLLINRSREAFVQQLANNITPDGMVRDFAERDALAYVTYSLEPMLTAAWIAKQQGQDWYSLAGNNGATLQQALHWLEPYASGARTHEEFRNTQVAFDRKRAAAGMAHFRGQWDRQGARNAYWLAARLDTQWTALASQLGGEPTWLKLLESTL
jgi:hypothetical protein